MYAIACEAYRISPDESSSACRRSNLALGGLDPHPPDAYFIALEDERVLGYGYLELDGEQWKNGFLGLARAARGRGLARAIKSAQIGWAKTNEVRTLRTANELRLVQMLALNERFGYRPLYTELVLRGPCA